MSDPTRVNSDLGLLAPSFGAAVAAALQECNAEPNKLDAMVFEAFRSNERQAWLFAQGRTRFPGKIVTNARTSFTSWHGYGLAVDVVHRTKFWAPFGKDAKRNEDWFARVAAIFKRHGCTWGGDWKKPDTPHMQWKGCPASPTQAIIDMVRGEGVKAVWNALQASGSAPPPVAAAASSPAPAAPPAAAAPMFGALVANGFFSATPFDLSIPRSIRTNNPGALNVRPWQEVYPGFAGRTQPDHAGNVTSIYRTPEHGVGAWFHLLTVRYGYGPEGEFTLRQLAQRYAGETDPNAPAARAYVKGWVAHSGGELMPDDTIRLAQDASVLSLARAMFAHEIGKDSPLHDDQILFGIQGERGKILPP